MSDRQPNRAQRHASRPSVREDQPIRNWAQRQAEASGGSDASKVSAPGCDEATARRWIAETAREIYHRKLSGATDGNLSIRLRNGLIATTPSGVHKGRLQPTDIVLVDSDGKVVGKPPRDKSGAPLRPSSEIALHTAAYRLRPDVGSVVHAHPPMAIAYTLAGGDLSQVLVSEVIFACGTIATAPYATPTTTAVPQALEPYLPCYDAVILHRHGSVTLGADLDQAMARLDALEHTALIYCTTKLLGGVAPIPAAEVDRLYALARPDAPWRQPGNHCPPASPQAQSGVDEALVAAVVAALRGGYTPPTPGGACR